MYLKEFWKKVNLTKNEKKKIEFEQILNYKTNNKTLIEIKNLSKFYKTRKKDIKVFENINLKIYENEIMALIGPNGAGKTTLVEIIADIKNQNSGEVIFNYKLDSL